MKPRNRFEKAVLAESKKLRPISKTQCKWAFRECIDHFAYRLPKGRTTCMDCGHSWTMVKPTDTCTCPHCRARLQVRSILVERTRKKNDCCRSESIGQIHRHLFLLLAYGSEKRQRSLPPYIVLSDISEVQGNGSTPQEWI